MTAMLLAVCPTRSAWVCQIRNRQSFHRHVREARRGGDIVVYCGGYPSRSVVALLARLRALGIERLHHWGDIDPAGLRIADRLAQRSGLALDLHLMSPTLATEFGRPLSPAACDLPIVPDSPTAVLAAYLMSPQAHLLEQERIDPVPTD